MLADSVSNAFGLGLEFPRGCFGSLRVASVSKVCPVRCIGLSYHRRSRRKGLEWVWPVRAPVTPWLSRMFSIRVIRPSKFVRTSILWVSSGAWHKLVLSRNCSSNTSAFAKLPMNQGQPGVLAAPLSASSSNSSSKSSKKHRPGKEKQTFDEASSNQPKRNQTHKPGAKLRGQVRDSPDIRTSKTLSWLLRHGAQSEGLKMRTDGYVKVDDLVRCLSPCWTMHIEAVVLAAEPEIESPEFDFKHD